LKTFVSHTYKNLFVTLRLRKKSWHRNTNKHIAKLCHTVRNRNLWSRLH